MRLTQLTEGPCDVAKPEEIEKMTGVEYDKYAQWKKDCESEERTTPLSTKRLESYDDYHGDMSKEEYDKTVKSSEMEYSVWVGGTEVNDNYLSYDEAVRLYDKYKAQGYDDVQLDARIKESVNEAEKRWKQTSMSPQEAIAKYGKENVKVKKGALRNGDDMVEVFVESYSPGDENEEGMVSNCCGAPIMDVYQGHGRCSDCKEMASAERMEESAIEEGTKGCADCEWIKAETDGDIDTCDECAAEERQKAKKVANEEEFYESYSNDGKTVTISDYQPEGEVNAHKKFNLRKKIHRGEDGKLIKSPYGGYKVSFHGNAEDVKAYAEQNLGEASKTQEEQLDEFLPALGVAAAAAAVGTGAYKVGKKIGNWASSKKTPTADTLPGDGMVKKAGSALQNRNIQMSKNLAALKSESEFSKKVKEAADEDAEAVSARDDFVKMMSSKPKSSNKAIDTIKKIVADKQNMQVKFDDGKMKVDLYTASAVSQVYDAVKPETQEKIDNMLRTKEGMLKMSNFAFSKLSEGLKEGKRLDEIIPLIPLAIGAARVLGPLAARQLAKHGVKKTIKNIPRIAKAVTTKGKMKTAKDVWTKTPLKKTAMAYGGADYVAGPDNLKNDIKNLVKQVPFTPLSTKSTNGSTTTNGPSKFIKRDMFDDEQTDGKVINEIQPEYTGADAVVDRNGKKHNPNSPKAKMIINMRKKNSGNKDSEEMSPKEIKAAKLARMKMLARGEQKRDKTARSVKNAFKKGMKSLDGLVGGTGFINPLAASKYSPEDKAMEMVEKAMDQALSEDK